MPAHEALNGIQFIHHADAGMTTPTHLIQAVKDVPWEGVDKSTRVHLGSMYWNAKGIVNVNVGEQHQRKGVATAMWNEGQRLASENARIPKPKHSPDRTTAGDAWARSVGGRLPRRKK